jgi:dTMP kinase
MNKGIIINIEGIDCAGKGTQSALLRHYIMDKYPKRMINTISFPQYHSPFGKLIRQYLDEKLDLNQFELNNLYSADRYYALPLLEDLLKNGCILILNRYTYSNIAYGAFHGDTVQRIEALDQFLPKPDLVIYLDIDPFISQQRNPDNQDRNESNLSYLGKVRETYIGLATSKKNWKMLDADQPKEEVHKDVAKVVEESKILDQ